MKFYLGRLVITPAVLTSMSVSEICYAIDRHVCGIWGNVSERIRKANESSLRNRGQLLSVYHTACGNELRVLTAADRLTTTVHLPGEFEHQRTPKRTPTELSRIKRNSEK